MHGKDKLEKTRQARIEEKVWGSKRKIGRKRLKKWHRKMHGKYARER
jgi:hypothetical protein